MTSVLWCFRSCSGTTKPTKDVIVEERNVLDLLLLKRRFALVVGILLGIGIPFFAHYSGHRIDVLEDYVKQSHEAFMSSQKILQVGGPPAHDTTTIRLPLSLQQMFAC